MIKEGKFGGREAGVLAVTTISSKVLLTSPRVVAENVGTAGYIMTLVSAFTALVGFFIIYRLVKRFHGENLNGILVRVYGKFLGNALALLVAAVFFLIGSSFLREFIELLKSYEMVMSPPSYLAGIAVVVIAVLAVLGLETITRVNYLFSTVVWGAMLFLFILSMKYFRFYFIAPIFGEGLDKILYHGVMRSSALGEVLLLAVISHSIQGSKEFKKAGLMGIGVSSWIVVTSFVTFTLSFPYFITREFTSPLYQLSRVIEYGTFFQRFEALFLVTWSMIAVLSMSIYFYISISLIARVLKLDNYKPLIWPLIYIFFAVSLYPDSIFEVIYGYINVIRQYAWTVFFGLPLITWIIASVTGKGGGKVEKSCSAAGG
ncbi:MAG: spore germination protein [Clostridia bacterium]|nr:spore germination protein [Clostridia bacterium]